MQSILATMQKIGKTMEKAETSNNQLDKVSFFKKQPLKIFYK